MNGSRFDQWTRRRVGLAMGAFAGSLLSLDDGDHAAAKKKHKKVCQKVTHECQNGSKKKGCCSGLHCEPNQILGGDRCCWHSQQPCSLGTQCCGELLCAEVPWAGTDLHCCISCGDACVKEHDCCSDCTCVGGTCVHA